MKNLMKKLSSNEMNEKPKMETETIKTEDGKELKRPILRTFHVSKDNATFEVSEKYEIKKVLGFGKINVLTTRCLWCSSVCFKSLTSRLAYGKMTHD
jgi:hypothetical protein